MKLKDILKIIILKIKFLFVLILIIQLQCASTEKIAFDSKNSYTNTTNKEIESGDKIDRWRTIELFFKLNKNEECIRINLTSLINDGTIRTTINLKTYFIIEKAVDISKFVSDKKIIFSEIGRNFDSNWNIKQEIDICSSETDPIKRLDNSGIYRIRFTTFKDINYNFSVIIYSKNIITITGKKPDFAN